MKLSDNIPIFADGIWAKVGVWLGLALTSAGRSGFIFVVRKGDDDCTGYESRDQLASLSQWICDWWPRQCETAHSPGRINGFNAPSRTAVATNQKV